MFNFFKKKKKKVYDKWFLLIFATVVVCLGIGNELYKGTSAVELPANEAFDDINFYKCIVDRYNYINDVEYDYTYNLSDEELLTISELNCHNFGENDNEKITSIKGIEKLQSLKSLSLSGNLLSEVDISNNVNLEELNFSDNKLTNLNVDKNIQLTSLMADRNELTSLNVSNNVGLKVLSVYDNELTELRIDNNLDLIYLRANLNKLTELDTTKNVKLQQLEIMNNQLTTLDVGYNEDLFLLAVQNNHLSELDLSNNNKLKMVYSNENNFDKNITLYKGDSIKLESIENVIKLPSEMSQDLFSWEIFETDNSNTITLDENGVVTAVNGGLGAVCGGINHEIDDSEDDIEYLLVCNIFNVIDISSEEYTINQEENFIYTGNNSLDENKIDVVGFDLNVDGNKLQILHSDILITELDILSVDFGTLTISDKVIKVDNEISYEDFTSNITKSEVLSYKIKYEEEELVDGSMINDGMILEIYYKDILLDSYEIKIVSEIVNDVIFNDNIVLDEENGYIKYNKMEFTVEQLLADLEIVGDARVFISSISGSEKTIEDLVVTGDVLTIFVGSEKQSEYKIAVRGDTNGDGKVSLADLVQLRKHIVGWKNPNTGLVEKKTGVYLYAIDMNNDGNIRLTDLVRVRKVLVGIDIDE